MSYIKQNELLLDKLMEYYKENNNLTKMLNIINGNSKISLRIVDWFATNFTKKYYTVFPIILIVLLDRSFVGMIILSLFSFASMTCNSSTAVTVPLSSPICTF